MSSVIELQAKIKIARGRFEQRPETRDFAPLADLLREAGQYTEALLILDKGLKKFPRYVTGYIIKGRALNESGYGALGKETLNAALELDPGNILALDLLIGEATGRKAWGEVLGPLEKLVALEPEDEKLVVFLDKVRQKLQEVSPVPLVREDYRDVIAEPIAEPASENNAEAIAEAISEPISEPIVEPIEKPIAGPIDEKEAVPEPIPTENLAVPGASHVTMTMVNIYLAQGYREMAITALKEIQEANPDRKDVQEKLAGLLDDPSCGVPESRKEKVEHSDPVVKKDGQVEQRLKDKAQFTRWIEGVTDEDEDPDGGDTP